MPLGHSLTYYPPGLTLYAPALSGAGTQCRRHARALARVQWRGVLQFSLDTSSKATIAEVLYRSVRLRLYVFSHVDVGLRQHVV